ncbi:hypothetical protein GCM10023195_55770 [Actinoallomurus liliacearum]|uniref:HTH araC/xylS-type domain-containing protein n=1 Tax=Actinoallomurus liliacearum TaxID=1080073 RepID=A0ABP8TPB6_9ACTN
MHKAQYVPAPVAEAGEASLAETREWALHRLGEPLTLRVLARHAGISQRTFMRRFTEETGTTPLQWLLGARLGRARELLETTDHSVDRVAQDCGLGTAANLRLHFRRALGTTPPPTGTPSPTDVARSAERQGPPAIACERRGRPRRRPRAPALEEQGKAMHHPACPAASAARVRRSTGMSGRASRYSEPVNRVTRILMSARGQEQEPSDPGGSGRGRGL